MMHMHFGTAISHYVDPTQKISGYQRCALNAPQIDKASTDLSLCRARGSVDHRLPASLAGVDSSSLPKPWMLVV